MKKIVNILKQYNIDIEKIEKRNDYYIVYSKNNKYLVLKRVRDISKIYSYFNSINYSYYLNSINSLEDDYLLFLFKDNITYDVIVRGKNEVISLSKLQKSSVFLEDSDDTLLDNIYNDIKEKINKTRNYYLSLHDKIDEENYLFPAKYLLIRNISSIYNLLNKSEYYLEKGYSNKDRKIRYSYLIMNNSLDNFIVSDSCYFISFNNYKNDLIILDFYDFYKKNIHILDMNMMIDIYEENFLFTDNEKDLLYSLICIVDTISFTNNNYNDVLVVRKTIDYCDKTIKFLLEENKEDKKTYKEKL